MSCDNASGVELAAGDQGAGFCAGKNFFVRRLVGNLLGNKAALSAGQGTRPA
ncbi:MAG: hypothetical protein ABSG62_22475 [Terracidiphilus sp.]|jgi:hypothetical protein